MLLHEFGHGLGFQTFTNGSTGAQIDGRPSTWDHFMRDTTQNLLWSEMTNAQRVASAINSRKLVWIGANVTAAAPGVSVLTASPSFRSAARLLALQQAPMTSERRRSARGSALRVCMARSCRSLRCRSPRLLAMPAIP